LLPCLSVYLIIYFEVHKLPTRQEKIWRVRRADPILKYILSRELKISPVLAHLLLNRGVYTVEEARLFLFGGLQHLAGADLMKDMGRAVDRILCAVKKGEKILVYGDYDVDGITATALMVRVLRRLGGRVDYYIPHRLTDGYGLHDSALVQAGKAGYTLVVTVDCGISGAAAVEAARRAGGPEVIITDHHQVPAVLPDAVAVLNPRRPDCHYPFKELAGVGVALKLAGALLDAAGEPAEAWRDYLDLACLGTVADIVPLLGENRILVRCGLPRLAESENAGIRALLAVSGIKNDGLDARAVGFALAPRLNAAGRLGDARPAVELLLCEDDARAQELAGRLNQGNRERQQIEAGVLAEALGILHGDDRLSADRVLVLAAAGWHPGVIGIVASRLMDMFYRPVLLVALDGEKGRGSGRSVPGFHLYRALEQCRDYLLDFGGHAGAAGFSLPADQVEPFREAINACAERMMPGETPVPVLDIDALVSLRDISPRLIAELAMLAPFGHGNPDPLLACHGVSVLSCREVGREGNHLKLLVRENGAVLDGIGFSLADCMDEVAAAKSMDLAFTPAIDCWRGESRLQLNVKDMRPVAEDEPAAAGDAPADPGEGKGFSFLFREAAQHLPGAGRALFLPGFMQRALAECRCWPGVELLPAWCRRILQPPCTAAPLPAAESSATTVEGLHLIDRRDRPGRPVWLTGLLAGGRRTLVLVNSPHRTVELASFLRHARPETGKRTVFCHAYQDEERRNSLWELFTAGGADVLITTPGLIPPAPGGAIEQVVVYHLPGDRQEWEMSLAAAGKGGAGEVYLPFGRDDARLIGRYLTSLAPDRDCLARLYLLLRRWKNITVSEGEEPAFLSRLTRRLKAAGTEVHRFTVTLGLAVLTELGLLHWPTADSLRVEERGNEKIPLTDSTTFCRAQQLKRNAGRWLEYVLNAPVDRLLAGPDGDVGHKI